MFDFDTDFWDKKTIRNVVIGVIAFIVVLVLTVSAFALDAEDIDGKYTAALGIDTGASPQIVLANLMDEKLLYKAMEGLQFERYHNIVKNEPNQKQFLKGWINKRVFNEEV